MIVVASPKIHDASTTVTIRFGVTSSLYLRCKKIARNRSTPIKVTVVSDAESNKPSIMKNENSITWIFSQIYSCRIPDMMRCKEDGPGNQWRDLLALNTVVEFALTKELMKFSLTRRLYLYFPKPRSKRESH